MQSISKLPYKTQFDPDYEEFSKRIEKFNIKNSVNSQFSSEMVTTLLDISTRAKESVRHDDLEYEHSNIYVQYASQNQMKDGQKNITEHCPGCGDGMKKNVQCSFCAIVYCKNCCFRKRVIPTLSGPKDSRDECNDCHQKFVKLFANQDFYYEYTILQKIIESTSKRISKLEEDSGKKKGKFEETQKRKKALKIKQNVLERERQKEEKKLQELNERLRETYQIAADKKRVEEEKHEAEEKVKIESAKKIREQREKEEREEKELKQRIEKEQKQKRLAKERQTQKQKEMVQQRQRKRLVEIERQQRRRSEESASIQQQPKKQQPLQIAVQKAQSLEKHKEEANMLKDLAENIVHHPIVEEHQKKKVETPIVVKIEDEQRIEPTVNIFQGLRKSYDEAISVNNSFDIQGSSKSNNNLNDYFGEQDLNPKPNSDSKTTEGDADQVSIEQLKQKNKEVDSHSRYKQMPQVAINVSQMTVNQLLGIHVNLQRDGASLTHNKTNRDSLSFEERRKSLIRSSAEMPKDEEITLSQQQKQMIFRKSLLTASAVPTIREDQHQQEYQAADPAGSKCNCNLM